jgi:hypothetical protein
MLIGVNCPGGTATIGFVSSGDDPLLFQTVHFFPIFFGPCTIVECSETGLSISNGGVVQMRFTATVSNGSGTVTVSATQGASISINLHSDDIVNGQFTDHCNPGETISLPYP